MFLGTRDGFELDVPCGRSLEFGETASRIFSAVRPNPERDEVNRPTVPFLIGPKKLGSFIGGAWFVDPLPTYLCLGSPAHCR